MLLVLGSFLTACEVIPSGQRDKVIFTPSDSTAIKRTSLLIEYSGWQCVNCPTAAEEAHRLKELYGEELVVVVMHPESNPNTRHNNKPALDYTCPEADSIYVMMGGTNTTPFPTGNVNLVKDAKGYFNDYDKWATLISQAYATPKPVLLTLEADYIDTNVRSIEFEGCAILTPHLGSSLPCVANLSLESPLISRSVCAIWVQRCQHIGVLRSKWRHVIDGSCHIVESAIRTEGHVLRTFSLRDDGQSFL